MHRSRAYSRTAPRCRSFLIVAAVLVILSGCARSNAALDYQHARSLYAAGSLAESADAAAKGAENSRRSGATASYWQFQLLRAEALLAQGKVSEASRLLDEPLPATPALQQLALRREMDRADACSKSGEMREALGLLEKIRPSATDPELKTRIDVLYGAVLGRVRRYDQAEATLRRALAEAEAQRDAYQQASAILNLSACRKWRNRYSEAVEYAVRSVRIAEDHGFRRIAAAADLNLGSLLTLLGDFDRASTYHQKAISLLTAVGDRGNLLLEQGELGILYRFQGKLDDAISRYERAFKLAKDLNRPSDIARNAVNIADAYIEAGNWTEAEKWNREAVESVAPENRSRPHVQLNTARIMEGKGQVDNALREYRTVLRDPESTPSVLWECHRQIGRIYAGRRQYSQADHEYRAVFNLVDTTRSELKRDFQITFLSRLMAFHQDYVDLLVDRNDDAAALRTVESSRARVLAERLGHDVPDVTTLDPAQLSHVARETRTALISFWTAPKRSFAWLIDKNGIKRFTLPPAGQLEALVSSYRQIVEHALKDPIASGDASGPTLWNALLKDIAPRIPKGGRVVIIPDGPLHHLNLETLPVPSPRPHYWIEDVELAVAPSLAIAASKIEAPVEHGERLLLIGAPDYSGSDFRPLDKAATELADIRSRFPRAATAVYEGPQASPETYRNSQPAQFSLIHFAAHADANNENPLESAIVLSRRADSNKLYARDVIDLPIHADLVTISGCRSAGVRTYAGEGLIGFAWAFLQAGARVVVAGLWDVSDTSTEPLMNEFYAGIASGRSPSAAMRRAKLTLRQQQPAYSKPFYWAPFQVYLRSVRE